MQTYRLRNKLHYPAAVLSYLRMREQLYFDKWHLKWLGQYDRLWESLSDIGFPELDQDSRAGEILTTALPFGMGSQV